MKYLLLSCLLLFSNSGFSQDTTKPIEKNQQTSFDNYELLVIAVVGFVVLMAVRYWFKRTRKR